MPRKSPEPNPFAAKGGKGAPPVPPKGGKGKPPMPAKGKGKGKGC